MTTKVFDRIVVSLLALATLVTRIPYVTQYLFAWDSGTVALGTRFYDIGQHQPHPPGYVLYVLTAKILNVFVHNINTVLVGMSIVAAGGTVILLYLLAARMYNRKVALVAASILLFSKSLWAYSEVAFSYTLQGFMAIAVVYCAYRFVQDTRNPRYAYVGSIVLAVAGGFRQDCIVFLMPLWAYITMRYARPHFWRLWALIVAICMLWMSGMVFWTGGVQAYMTALTAQLDFVSGFSVEVRGTFGLKENYHFMIQFLKDSTIGILISVFFLGHIFSPKKIFQDIRLQLILLWILPAAIFYLCVHIGERGYLLTFLPACVLILAIGLVWVADECGELLHSKMIVPLSMLAVAVGFFIMLNVQNFLGSNSFLSQKHLQLQDQATKAKIEYLQSQNPNEKIFFDRENFKQLHYYLPEYQIYFDDKTKPESDKPVEDLMLMFPVQL